MLLGPMHPLSTLDAQTPASQPITRLQWPLSLIRSISLCFASSCAYVYHLLHHHRVTHHHDGFLFPGQRLCTCPKSVANMILHSQPLGPSPCLRSPKSCCLGFVRCLLHNHADTSTPSPQVCNLVSLYHFIVCCASTSVGACRVDRNALRCHVCSSF